MPSLLRLAGGILAVALLAASCGGSSPAGVPFTVLTVPVVTTAAPLRAPQLQAIIVQPGDLPAGWKPVPVAPTSPHAADNAPFSRCIGEMDASADRLARADNSFATGAAVLTSTASTFASAADVQADTSAITSAKAPDCLTSVVRAQWSGVLPKGAALKSVSETVTPGAGGGPAAVVATVVGAIVFAASGRTLTVNSEVVYLAAGKLEAQVVFTNAAGPVSAALVTDVVEKVAARLPSVS
ncbi:MAG TPA: hypothetical protein VHT75_00675 [Acidimicrobiales bacterium]|jgi:hypothetical protein|nr:hypothetical protein [Acidimicrobiales bacterium]